MADGDKINGLMIQFFSESCVEGMQSSSSTAGSTVQKGGSYKLVTGVEAYCDITAVAWVKYYMGRKKCVVNVCWVGSANYVVTPSTETFVSYRRRKTNEL